MGGLPARHLVVILGIDAGGLGRHLACDIVAISNILDQGTV